MQYSKRPFSRVFGYTYQLLDFIWLTYPILYYCTETYDTESEMTNRSRMSACICFHMFSTYSVEVRRILVLIEMRGLIRSTKSAFSHFSLFPIVDKLILSKCNIQKDHFRECLVIHTNRLILSG